jgi:hypothetical protein
MMIDDPSVHTVLLYMYSYLDRGATGTGRQCGTRQPRPDAQTHHIISINIAYPPDFALLICATHSLPLPLVYLSGPGHAKKGPKTR